MWESYTLINICTVWTKTCRLHLLMAWIAEPCSRFESVIGIGSYSTSKIILQHVRIRCEHIWGTPTQTWLREMIPKSSFKFRCANWGSYFMLQRWPNRDSGIGVNISRIKRYSRSVRYLSITSRGLAKSFRSCWSQKKFLKVSTQIRLWKTPIHLFREIGTDE